MVDSALWIRPSGFSARTATLNLMRHFQELLIRFSLWIRQSDPEPIFVLSRIGWSVAKTTWARLSEMWIVSWKKDLQTPSSAIPKRANKLTPSTIGPPQNGVRYVYMPGGGVYWNHVINGWSQKGTTSEVT